MQTMKYDVAEDADNKKQCDEMRGSYVETVEKKRWFHCSCCTYKIDRQHHARMHFIRIHINGGKSCERKRKYQDKVLGVAEYFKQNLYKKPKVVVKHKPMVKVGIQTEMLFGTFTVITTKVDGVCVEDVDFFDFMSNISSLKLLVLIG